MVGILEAVIRVVILEEVIQAVVTQVAVLAVVMAPSITKGDIQSAIEGASPKMASEIHDKLTEKKTPHLMIKIG